MGKSKQAYYASLAGQLTVGSGFIVAYFLVLYSFLPGDTFDQLDDIALGSKDEVELISPDSYACAHEGRKAIVTRSEGIVTVDFKGAAEGDISIQYPEMSWADYTPKPDGKGGYEYEITPKSAWPGHISDAKRHCYGNKTL